VSAAGKRLSRAGQMRKKPNHRRSHFVEAAVEKTTWLRQQKGVDLDVVETVELLAEALVRLDARVRVSESHTDRKLAKLRKEYDDHHDR